MTEDTRVSVPTAKRAYQHLWLPGAYDAYESLHLLTMLSTLAPHRRDASRCTIPSRFRCHSESAGTLSEGSRTVCCLAALPRRVRSMGRTVCLLWQTIIPVVLQVTACEAPRGSLPA